MCLFKKKKNHSTTQVLEWLTKAALARALLFFVLTALFVFQPVFVLESLGRDTENKYHGFYVVSSYKNFDNAAALEEKLKALGYDPFSKTVNIPNKGKYCRVYVNLYGNKKEALLAGKKLKESGVIKGFFLLLKTDSDDKRIVSSRKTDKLVSSGKADKEDDKNTSPLPVLTKIEIPAIPPVPASEKEKTNLLNIKEKTDPSSIKKNTESPNIKEDIKLSNIKENTDLLNIKENIEPSDTKEIRPSHKPDKKDTGLNTGGKAYDSAMDDFTAGKYEDALAKFKKIIKIEKNEAATRRMADCYYFLGEKGDKRYFSQAMDQYRNIIQNYPGSNKENAQAIFRLAQSLSRLNLYYEALMEFKNLCLGYPESGYFPESLYMMGKMYYKTENFNGAIMNFKEYIKRFPEGKLVREAYFRVGDCYSRMRQFDDADVWYGNALKRWPALEDIPEDTLTTLGSHYFQIEKYNEALRVLFVYLNLFPNGENSRNALYTIARSFEEMGQLPQALKVLSQVLERYPESMEARKSEFIMTNIGVEYPEIKLPVYILSGMDYYRNPIEAYDKMREKLSNLDREEELVFRKANLGVMRFDKDKLVFREELVFRKGSALIKKKRYKEAFDNCRIQLNRFPNGKYRKAGEKNLILSAAGLIDDCYSKKDYLAVSEVYFNSDRNVLFGNGNFDMLFKIGTSLEKIDLSDHAAGVFEEMIKVFAEDKRINKVLLAMARIDYGKTSYESAKKRLKDLLGNPSKADKKTAMTARQLLGDICYKQGLFKEAVGFYSDVLGTEEKVEDSAAIRKKYADSLKGMGLYSSALINYKRVLKNCKDRGQKCSASLIMGSYEGLGDCLYSKENYQQAILMYEQSLKSTSEGKGNLWAIFNIGRGYAKLGNKPMADNSFSLLKKETDNEFWSRVMDYYTTDKNRSIGLKI